MIQLRPKSAPRTGNSGIEQITSHGRSFHDCVLNLIPKFKLLLFHMFFLGINFHCMLNLLMIKTHFVYHLNDLQ